MMLSVRRAFAVLGSIILLLAGCGEAAPDVEAGAEQTADARTGWASHTLAPHGADRFLVGILVEDDAVVVLSTEESGRVHAHVVWGDGNVEEGTVDFDPPPFPILGGVANGPDGFVAAGSDPSDEGRNFVLVSSDGRSWSEAEISGLDTRMDVHGLIATNDRYVLAATLRTADDPARGGFVPAILTSTDGRTWTAASAPDAAEGSVRDLALGRSGLYAVVDVDGDTQLWTSSEGTDWSPLADAPRADLVVSSGDVLLAADTAFGEGPPVVYRSADGASTWEEAAVEAFGGRRLHWIGGGSEGFVAITEEARVDPFLDDPTRCYADIERCRFRPSERPTEVLMTSADGIEWTTTSVDGLDGLFRPESVLRTGDGGTVVLGSTDDGNWGAWTWSADAGPLPPADPIGEPAAPSYDGPPLIEFDGSLPVGEIRAFPLYIHCGFGLLGQFDGVLWLLAESEGPTPETGAGQQVPEEWPAAGQTLYGFVTRIDEQTIEYTVDAQAQNAIATYVADPDAVISDYGCA